MPKVCVMSSVHVSTDTRIYHKEIISLSKAGYEVVFLNKDCTRVDGHGVQFKKVKMPSSRLARIIFAPTKMFICAFKEKADIYNFHDPELIFVGAFLALMGKKVIYDVHEDVPRDILGKEYIKPHLRKIIASTFEFFEKNCAKLFVMNVVAAPFIKDAFEKYKCSVICITNYPKLDEFALESDYVDKKENTACYVGGLEEFRGIYELIEAIWISKGVLELGGSFSDEAYEKKCLNNPGWNKVNYHGYVNREELAKITTSSLVGMLPLLPRPNHYNAMPNKMFEYMAAGIPIIASDFPYWRKMLERGGCGLCVDPTNPEAIAKAINHLIENPTLARKMGERGRELVLNKYNWNVEEKKLLKLYQLILEKKGGKKHE